MFHGTQWVAHPTRCMKLNPKVSRTVMKEPIEVLPSTLASSTRMISLRRMAGEVWRTLYTVLSRVLQASLWNTIITLVVGKGGHRLKVCSMHLYKEGKEHKDLTILYTSWVAQYSYYISKLSPVGSPFQLWHCMCGNLWNTCHIRVGQTL